MQVAPSLLMTHVAAGSGYIPDMRVARLSDTMMRNYAIVLPWIAGPEPAGTDGTPHAI